MMNTSITDSTLTRRYVFVLSDPFDENEGVGRVREIGREISRSPLDAMQVLNSPDALNLFIFETIRSDVLDT